MPRMFASDRACVKAELGTGRSYTADRRGFIHVENSKDAAMLKAAGYVQAGNTPVVGKRAWVCECGWEALINHCPKCDRDDLERVG